MQAMMAGNLTCSQLVSSYIQVRNFESKLKAEREVHLLHSYSSSTHDLQVLASSTHGPDPAHGPDPSQHG